MEIKEMITRKKELEAAIAERLQLFENETGVFISDIRMDTIDLSTYSKADRLISVKIKVEL